MTKVSCKTEILVTVNCTPRNETNLLASAINPQARRI